VSVQRALIYYVSIRGCTELNTHLKKKKFKTVA